MKIKLTDILDKHMGDKLPNYQGRVLAAMREACELTVDKCNELAAIKIEGGKIRYTSHTCKSTTYIIDKDSIEQVKQLIV